MIGWSYVFQTLFRLCRDERWLENLMTFFPRVRDHIISSMFIATRDHVTACFAWLNYLWFTASSFFGQFWLNLLLFGSITWLIASSSCDHVLFLPIWLKNKKVFLNFKGVTFIICYHYFPTAFPCLSVNIFWFIY